VSLLLSCLRLFVFPSWPCLVCLCVCGLPAAVLCHAAMFLDIAWLAVLIDMIRLRVCLTVCYCADACVHCHGYVVVALL